MGEEVIYEPTPVLTKVTALRATLNEICERSYFIPAAFLDIIITPRLASVCARAVTHGDELSSRLLPPPPPKLRHHRARPSPEIICHLSRAQRQMHF